MKSSNLITFLFIGFLMSFIGYSKGPAKPHVPLHAPPGAIEYFETVDGKSWIGLFDDGLRGKVDGLLGGDINVPIADITSVKKAGSILFINSPHGQVQLDLGAFSGYAAARSLKEKIDEMRSEQH